jgi:hypothetical protein
LAFLVVFDDAYIAKTLLKTAMKPQHEVSAEKLFEKSLLSMIRITINNEMPNM